TLFAMSEAVRLAVGLLEPVMPETTEKVYALLGQTPDSNWKARLVRNEKLAGSTVGAKTILFPKPPVEA
ncbi:MAG: methionine--tRNA ligase, partial [Verrucomicrobiia bacterium]